VDVDSGERDNAVPYKVMMSFRAELDPLGRMKPCFGRNGVPEGDGVISVGDVVRIM
jgi:uncharacterized protein